MQSMFNMVNGTCASDTTTALLNQATTGLARSYFRSSFNCTQEEPVWSGSTDALDRTIFCGYREVGFSCRSFASFEQVACLCNASSPVSYYAGEHIVAAIAVAIVKSMRLWHGEKFICTNIISTIVLHAFALGSRSTSTVCFCFAEVENLHASIRSDTS